MTKRKTSLKATPEAKKLKPEVAHTFSDVDGVEHSENLIPEWQKTMERMIPAIVSIRFSQVSSFDTEPPCSSEATGFVVDKERGIILTNRHVTGSGPFVGEAIFHDHEEVDVFPIYRDPIHDFGFLRFDPSKIKYMKLAEIELHPEKAVVGLDIRVVGNDAGEKLSILAGSLSRLDRNAPDYGDLTYNDFNTLYLQASASTSGGSSGSPVLSIEGHAVGLQAGGHVKAATDFFFPLDRVKRALILLQQGLHVARGTIETRFLHQPFDEVRRLGLSPKTEAIIRAKFPQEIGMLVVESALPGGPAASLLEEGDILVKLDGNYITQFVPLEAALDSSVGKTVVMEIERGSKAFTFEIGVHDLHAITPSSYLEFGGAKFHNLSYQLAQQYCVPVKGVYVAETGGMFRFEGVSGVIVKSVNAQPTPDLETFIEVAKSLKDMDRVPVTYYSLLDVHCESMYVATVERHWSAFRLAKRNDKLGVFDFTDLNSAQVERAKPNSLTAAFPTLEPNLGLVRDLFYSFVKVTFSTPFKIEGFPRSKKHGAGLILDVEQGLVVTASSTVPYNLGDIWLTFADSIHALAKLEFSHPTFNWVILRYNPAHICNTPVKAAQLDDALLRQGEAVYVAGINGNGRPISTACNVTDVSPMLIPNSPVPRFRAVNFLGFTLDTHVASQAVFGVVTSQANTSKVRGLWLRYLGEPREDKDMEYPIGCFLTGLLEVLDALRKGKLLKLRGIAAELMAVQMATARHMGLTDEWIKRFENLPVMPRELFMVSRVECGSPAAANLMDTDLILAFNDTPLQSIEQVAPRQDWDDTVKVTLLRKKQLLELQVPMSVLKGDETDRVIFFAGAMIHAPHQSVRLQSKTLPSQCYVVNRARGSPAYMYGLYSTQWITHIDDKPTPNLGKLWDAVKNLKEGEYVRIRLTTFDFIPLVCTVKMNFHYFPTSQLVRSSASEIGWSEQVLP